MTYLLLLEVTDEESAKALAGYVVQKSSVAVVRHVDEPFSIVDGMNINDTIEARLRGVWKKPTQFCQHTDNHRKGKTASAFTRGQKYGWWICSVCHKPTESWATGETWDYALGTNLAPKEVTGRPGIAGWDSPVRWNFLLDKLPGNRSEVSSS